MLTVIQSPEFYKLRGYLDAICDLSSGENYEAMFDLLAYDCSGKDVTPVDVLKSAYPEDHIDNAQIIECLAENMVNDVNQALTMSTWSLSDKSASWDSSDNIVPIDLRGFWSQLKALINYNDAKVFKYEGELKYTYVYWWFTYVIHQEEQRRCVVFHGGSSD
jgi:hypothetical protein